MMMYKIFLAISWLCSIAAIIWLLRVRNHDRVLYRFCQVRRDIMTILRDRGFEMTKSDYHALRDLLEAVSDTIHHFNECKSTIFNIRTLSRIIREFRESGRAINKINIPKDAASAKTFVDFRMAMVMAFLAYTPFFRSEIAARVILGSMAAILRLVGRFGVESGRRFSEDLSYVLTQLNTYHHQHA